MLLFKPLFYVKKKPKKAITRQLFIILSFVHPSKLSSLRYRSTCCWLYSWGGSRNFKVRRLYGEGLVAWLFWFGLSFNNFSCVLFELWRMSRFDWDLLFTWVRNSEFFYSLITLIRLFVYFLLVLSEVEFFCKV